MFNYTKRYVNSVSIIFSIIIYFFLHTFNFLPSNIYFNSSYIMNIFKKNEILVEIISNSINQDTKENKVDQNNQPISLTEEKTIQSNWKIIIPKISLEAEISEGTSKNTMDKYVGHFDETSKSNGNIGLAAHNRGYPVNYFSQIKLLDKGDVIIYKFYNFEQEYIVTENKIIKDTDWSCLENTNDNKITLITCVENNPQYRRCVQATKKDKEVI